MVDALSFITTFCTPPAAFGTIIGILQGSTAASTFNYSAYSNYGSTLNISTPAVSEAFTAVSFGLLLALGLGGLGIAARRKKSTP